MASNLRYPRYHLRGDLYFERDELGWVTIDSNGRRLKVPPNEWASVVAFTSRAGDTAEGFAAAERLLDAPPPGEGDYSGPTFDFDPRTALGKEHMQTLQDMADDVRRARDKARGNPLP